jgi:hypothetical protein
VFEVTRLNVNQLVDARAIQVRMNRDHPDGKPRWWTIRRNGATKTWKTNPARFRLPWKAGLRVFGAIDGGDFVDGVLRPDYYRVDPKYAEAHNGENLSV